MRGKAGDNVDRSREYFFQPRVALLSLQQQQTGATQTKIDFPLFAARMEMPAGHKILTADPARVKMGNTGVEFTFSGRGIQHLDVIHDLLASQLLTGVFIGKNVWKILNTGGFTQ